MPLGADGVVYLLKIRPSLIVKSYLLNSGSHEAGLETQRRRQLYKLEIVKHGNKEIKRKTEMIASATAPVIS